MNWTVCFKCIERTTKTAHTNTSSPHTGLANYMLEWETGQSSSFLFSRPKMQQERLNNWARLSQYWWLLQVVYLQCNRESLTRADWEADQKLSKIRPGKKKPQQIHDLIHEGHYASAASALPTDFPPTISWLRLPEFLHSKQKGSPS